MNDKQIEAEIQAKGLTAPRVTAEVIENLIVEQHFFTALHGVAGAQFLQGIAHMQSPDDVSKVEVDVELSLGMITICVLILRNGHQIVGVNPGPVSADNFDAEIGKKIARQKAIDQVWQLEGYLLRHQLHVARINEGSL